MAISRTTFDEQFAAATRRGEQRLASEPCAVAARYDRQKRVVVIDLNSGCSLLLPPGLAQGLSDASPVELGEISILGPGTSISWPRLDVQFSIAGLLAGAPPVDDGPRSQQEACREAPHGEPQRQSIARPQTDVVEAFAKRPTTSKTPQVNSRAEGNRDGADAARRANSRIAWGPAEVV